jgi:hypothetical protein
MEAIAVQRDNSSSAQSTCPSSSSVQEALGENPNQKAGGALPTSPALATITFA